MEITQPQAQQSPSVLCVYRVLVRCPTYGKRATPPAARRLPGSNQQLADPNMGGPYKYGYIMIPVD